MDDDSELAELGNSFTSSSHDHSHHVSEEDLMIIVFLVRIAVTFANYGRYSNNSTALHQYYLIKRLELKEAYPCFFQSPCVNPPTYQNDSIYYYVVSQLTKAARPMKLPATFLQTYPNEAQHTAANARRYSETRVVARDLEEIDLNFKTWVSHIHAKAVDVASN
jgi:hypothetical protein